MGRIKDINIKNRTYYFYDDMVNIKDFDSNFLKIDKKSLKNIAIYYIGYTTKKDKYAINKVNPFYLNVHEVDGFIEEKEGSKYLNFAFTDSNSEVLKNMQKFGVELKIKTKKDQLKIVANQEGKYRKDYMKTKFNSDDDLPLNKQLKFINLTIIVRTGFEDGGKYYPQIFLDGCLYES